MTWAPHGEVLAAAAVAAEAALTATQSDRRENSGITAEVVVASAAFDKVLEANGIGPQSVDDQWLRQAWEAIEVVRAMRQTDSGDLVMEAFGTPCLRTRIATVLLAEQS